MKVSQEEIDAVIKACPRIYESEAAKILEVAYLVRKARKLRKKAKHAMKANA